MYQSTTLIGNVGQTPELKYTNTGIPVCNLSLAINEGWTADDGQRHERTTWVRVTCWRKLAETVAEYVQAGRQVMVSGKLTEPQPWIDKEGNPRASIEVTANIVQFLGSANDGSSNAAMDEEVMKDAYTAGYQAALQELASKAEQKAQDDEVYRPSRIQSEPEAAPVAETSVEETIVEEPSVEAVATEETAVESTPVNEALAEEEPVEEENVMLLDASSMLNGSAPKLDQEETEEDEPVEATVDENIPF